MFTNIFFTIFGSVCLFILWLVVTGLFERFGLLELLTGLGSIIGVVIAICFVFWRLLGLLEEADSWWERKRLERKWIKELGKNK